MIFWLGFPPTAASDCDCCDVKIVAVVVPDPLRPGIGPPSITSSEGIRFPRSLGETDAVVRRYPITFPSLNPSDVTLAKV